jgi:hypothetical protein
VTEYEAESTNEASGAMGQVAGSFRQSCDANCDEECGFDQLEHADRGNDPIALAHR